MKAWLADRLARHAADRLRRHYPDWAEAMTAECDALSSEALSSEALSSDAPSSDVLASDASAAEDARLGWAAGCAVASYRTPRAMGTLGYLGALIVGLAAMSAFQWSEDESLATLAVMAAIAVLLGAVGPRRFLLSGLAVGAVVAGVNGFGSLTGIQPDYETTRHSLLHCLRWLVLLAPALLAAAVGREVGLKLRT